MSTPAQIAANQSNAQLSTGPITAAGKAASSQNNFRHGLRGNFRVLPNENQADFDGLVQALEDEHQPAGYTETLLVDHMAEHEWMIRRVLAIINQLTSEPGKYDSKTLAVWLRYQTNHTRSFHRCLSDLLKLRAERRREQIGFERQKLAAAAEARKQETAEARNRQMDSRSAARELATAIKAARHAAPASSPQANLEHNAPQNVTISINRARRSN